MNDRADEKISYQKSLSALFASFAVLGFGALSLLNNFSMDYYSIMFMLSIVLPAGLSLGFIGFVLGKIFDEGSGFAPIKKIKKKLKTPENPYKIQSMFSPSGESEESMFDTNEETGGHEEF